MGTAEDANPKSVNVLRTRLYPHTCVYLHLLYTMCVNVRTNNVLRAAQNRLISIQC